MKVLKIISFVFFSAGLMFSQVETMSNFQTPKIKYYEDFLNFAEDNHTRMDVFVQVPFKGIQFVRTAKGLQGGYSVTVSVYDENKKNLIIEKMWNEKIKIASFDEATNKDNFNISHRSFKLKPGTYFIKTVLMDKDSKQEYPAENLFKVEDLSHKPSISDILLIRDRTVVNGKSKIVPNVSRNISGEKHGIDIYFEVYTDSSGRKSVEYVITGKKDKVIYSKTETDRFKAGKNQLNYTIKDSTLTMGTYRLTVSIKDDEGNIVASSTKEFYSHLMGLPFTITDIDKAISQLRYIANPDELDYIEEGKNEKEKTKRFINFWKKKDPSPGNEENEAFEEYYRRVSYANKSFSNYTEGWRSDRGMVFIILGAPNNVERHPFDYDAKPYEVWQYYDLNQNFVFVDETGFGDYRLVTPLYGDFFRYRY
ncbi:hypothetical protein BMS3Abin03_00732 [bacterium BMS3Abin03]|nr:hypothetical protein BMS3Abin03_00732 [bacterium BMS3Abin03]